MDKKPHTTTTLVVILVFAIILWAVYFVFVPWSAMDKKSTAETVDTAEVALIMNPGQPPVLDYSQNKGTTDITKPGKPPNLPQTEPATVSSVGP